MFFFMCSKHKTDASNEHHHIWSIHTRETEMRSKVGHLSQVNVIYALRDCCLTFRRRKKIIEKPENITVLLFRFSSCKHRALEYKQMYARAKTNAWIIIICLIYREIYGCNGYGLSDISKLEQISRLHCGKLHLELILKIECIGNGHIGTFLLLHLKVD